MVPHSGEMVKAALKAKGMTQIQLARRIGKNQTLISRYLSGQIEISVEAARSIAEVLEIDFEQLRRQLQRDKLERRMENLRAEFKEFLEVEETETVAVGGVMEVSPESIVIQFPHGRVSIPLLDSIPTGAIKEPKKEVEPHILPPGVQMDSEKSFALKVSGESMTDGEVGEGDIIVVDPSAEVQDGSKALVILSGEPVLGKIHRIGENIVLQSPGEREGSVIFLSQEDEFEIVGRVVLCIKFFAC